MVAPKNYQFFEDQVNVTLNKRTGLVTATFFDSSSGANKSVTTEGSILASVLIDGLKDGELDQVADVYQYVDDNSIRQAEVLMGPCTSDPNAQNQQSCESPAKSSHVDVIVGVVVGICVLVCLLSAFYYWKKIEMLFSTKKDLIATANASGETEIPAVELAQLPETDSES